MQCCVEADELANFEEFNKEESAVEEDELEESSH